MEAVAEVYGDGAALSAVILDYGQPIEASSIEVADFHVPGRNIIQAYVADQAARGKQKLAAGKYVVLELEQLPMTEQGMEPVHDDLHPRKYLLWRFLMPKCRFRACS